MHPAQSRGHDFFRHLNEALPVLPKEALIQAIRAVEDVPSARVANFAAGDFVGRSFLHTLGGIQRLVIVIAYQPRKKEFFAKVYKHTGNPVEDGARRALSTLSFKPEDLQKLLLEPTNDTDEASDDVEDIPNPPVPAIVQPSSAVPAPASFAPHAGEPGASAELALGTPIVSSSSRMMGVDFLLG